MRSQPHGSLFPARGASSLFKRRKYREPPKSLALFGREPDAMAQGRAYFMQHSFEFPDGVPRPSSWADLDPSVSRRPQPDRACHMPTLTRRLGILSV
jgi:hypothetical protein